ncbi:MAG: head decoration protein [Alphaproteobacteria bacterium]|nr:head decoration protein [Alphaproteobacteria bacterium]
MAVLSEGKHTGEFLVTEGPGYMSRDAVTIAAGAGVLPAGTVLGARRLNDQVTVTPAPANTGDGTVSEVVLGVQAEIGIYALVAMSATEFSVVSPFGDMRKPLTVGEAYQGDHLQLTVTAGAVPFVAGDTFEVTVLPGDKHLSPLDPAADDGTQFAYGILYAEVDATLTAVRAVGIVRHAEVNASALTWPAGINAPQQSAAIAQLTAHGVIVR